MLDKFTTKLQKASKDDLYKISLESSQAKDLQSYLNGPVPKLPLEITNGQDFFIN